MELFNNAYDTTLAPKRTTALGGSFLLVECSVSIKHHWISQTVTLVQLTVAQNRKYLKRQAQFCTLTLKNSTNKSRIQTTEVTHQSTDENPVKDQVAKRRKVAMA
ncbi:hypothetical protein Peur_027717 [Populus x canadensis]